MINNKETAMLILDSAQAAGKTGAAFLNPGDVIRFDDTNWSKPFSKILDVLENGHAQALMASTQFVANTPWPLVTMMVDELPEEPFEQFKATLNGDVKTQVGKDYKVVEFRDKTWNMDEKAVEQAEAAPGWDTTDIRYCENLARDLKLQAEDGTEFWISSGVCFLRGTSVNGEDFEEIAKRVEAARETEQ